MESTEAYLDRKRQELRLLGDSLEHQLNVAAPRTIDDVVKIKFQLTAALRAEHDRRAWKLTETSWSHASSHVSGPFTFSYDYQRADLETDGPSFYEREPNGSCETIYAASGMAAISACLVAVGRLMGAAELIVPSGSYGETIELAESFSDRLSIVRSADALTDAPMRSDRRQIVLLDSSAPGASFESILRIDGEASDLLLFDTTCFASTSLRIRRALRWARQQAIPVAMVRSHTKLDFLGAEYGRLGSITLVGWDDQTENHLNFSLLAAEVRNAIRLLGSAAVPAHFPPYVGTPEYRMLSRRRAAAMLRNCRRAARYVRSALADRSVEVMNHGLYLTLRGPQQLDEDAARKMADRMSEDLGKRGLPIRHAGSFGFDFAATEWFQDPDTGAYSVRVAIPDIPTGLCEELAYAIAKWWSEHQQGC